MRKLLVSLAILAFITSLPELSRTSQVEAQGKLSQKERADVSSATAMNNSVNPSVNESRNDISDLSQLAHILENAYGNALIHGTPNAEPVAEDLLLENASVRFASRIVHELTGGSCQRNERSSPGPFPGRACLLDDESLDLTALSDMLSYAAFRLEDLGSSASSTVAANSQRIPGMARIGSMAHLYRVVFALFRIHLDGSQSGVYLEAASDQLRLARKQMEVERSLCACDDREYTARLVEMLELEDQLKTMRGAAAR